MATVEVVEPAARVWGEGDDDVREREKRESSVWKREDSGDEKLIGYSILEVQLLQGPLYL